MDREKKRLIQEENQRIRWLRLQVDLILAVIQQDPSIKLQQARALVLSLRRSVLNRFPGKEGTFDLILLPRLERAVRERFGEGVDSSLH